MYERLSNKKEVPTMEAFVSHTGTATSLFHAMNDYIMNALATETKLYFDAHDKGWGIRYHAKKEYVCDIIAEKDAFLLVTRLSEDNLNNLYERATLYAKACIDSSPYKHRGWIEYRVLDTENIEESKMILQVRTSGKQKSIAQ